MTKSLSNTFFIDRILERLAYLLVGIGRIGIGTVVLSSCMTIIVSVFVYALWLKREYGLSITLLPFAFLALLYLWGLLSAKYCVRKFGGVTGDIFGAVSEISEIFFLMGVSAWLLRST